MTALELALEQVERGRVPDRLVRWGIRRLCEQGLRERRREFGEPSTEATKRFIRECQIRPIAPDSDRANDQHYEVPAEFFALALGPHRKYSCCYWGEGIDSLDAAEAASLAITCERAELADGMRILELGCGWGSLSLWMAEQYRVRRSPRFRTLRRSDGGSRPGRMSGDWGTCASSPPT